MNQQTHMPTDDRIASLLRDAVSTRVDQLLDAAAPSSPMPVATVSRRRWLVPIVAALSTLAVGGGVVHQLAQQRTPSIVDVAVRADATDEPRFVLNDAGFKAVAFQRYSNVGNDSPAMVHLRNGRTWFDVTIVTSADSMEIPEVVTKKSVAVGDGDATLELAKGLWAVRWTRNEVQFRAFGKDEPDQTVFDVLNVIRSDSPRTVALVPQFPHGFTGSLVDQTIAGYYVGLKSEARSADGPDVSLRVSPERPFASDYQEGMRRVQRNGRTYVLRPVAGGPGRAAGFVVSFSNDGYEFSLSSSGTEDQVLALAEKVRPATAKEWAEIEALPAFAGSYGPASSTFRTPPPVLDGDVDGTPFTITSPITKSGCSKLVFRAERSSFEACIPDSSASPFRLLSSTIVNKRIVVFGVTPAAGENQVVRIVDANGDVVAEDVTIDQELIDGRAFALDLPADAVAPFSAELYEYDRAWYADSEPEPDSFVKPGTTPIATLDIPEPVERS
jgi:hypothetical protein